MNNNDLKLSFFYDQLRQTVTIRDTFNGTFEQVIDAYGKTVGGNVEWKSHIVTKALTFFKTT
jgi:hypothetical protein